MSTVLSEHYPKIRYEVLRKNDLNVLPDTDLELAVGHVLEFGFEGFAVIDESGTKVILPEMTDKERKLLILRTALSLLLPEDAFSYKTASLSKTLEGIPGIERQIADIQSRILNLETEGQGRIYSDDEFGLYYNQAQRFENTISKSISGG